ncbi:MAG: HAD hydrolase-like protein [Candidatus Moraniibacteriota bacterium]
MKKDKAIVFDFDGVFVDDFDFHKKHIESFLDIKMDNKAFYEIHSGNVYEDDDLGLELGNFDVQKYCQSIKSELIKLPIVEGMDDVARWSQEIGKSFIVSSGCEGNIKDFFKEKNICENLCTIYGVETNPSKEKKFEKILKNTKLDVENIIFVTDTLGDLKEANSLGIASIAVTWGFQRVDTLEKGAPFGFANSSGDIVKLIKEYF